MEIRSIAFGKITLPLKRPFITALRRVENVEAILVRIETEDGRVGYGETAPTHAITGETEASIFEGLQVLRRALIGKELEAFDTLIETLSASLNGHPNARAAMEIALYDLAAQMAEQPLAVYLGGAVRPLTTGITISLDTIPAMLAQAQQALAEGFTSLKIKLGSDAGEDIARIRAIYEAIGTEASYKLDANQGWRMEETITFLNAIEERGIPIDFIEQPLSREDLDGLATIRRHTSIPILLDESVFTLDDAKRALEKEAADYINIKLDKSGGISEALMIADFCADAGVHCMVGCMLEGAISVGAAAHLAAARPETITMVDLDAPMLCAALPVQGGVRFDHPPNVMIPSTSGLGIAGVEGAMWQG